MKLFERSNTNEYNLSFLFKNNKTSKEKQFLEFTANGTPRGQLFITQIRSTNLKDYVSDIQDILNVLDWFQNALTVIHPKAKNTGKRFTLPRNANIQNVFKNMLEYFDPGIDGIEFMDVDFNQIDIPTEVKEDIKIDLLREKLKETSLLISSSQGDKYYIVSIADGPQVQAKLLKTKHKVAGGGYKLFDLKGESNETKIILGLIPLIIDFLNGGKVFVIDEIESSLHPNLIRAFFEFLLDQCENTNSQLIASSHKATLSSHKTLRKDAVWLAVKTKEGATNLHSLEEYKVDFDNELTDDYLLGRYKGIPKLGYRNHFQELRQSN